MQSSRLTCIPHGHLHRAIIPDAVLIQLFSWGWAQGCSKHVEDSNKHTIEETVRQFVYVPEQGCYLILWYLRPIPGLTASSIFQYWFLSGLLSSSPCSLEYICRVLSYLIISLKAFISLSSSLEISFKILDSKPRSVLSHLYNISCRNCSFHFFPNKGSVFDSVSVLVMNGRLCWIWKIVWLIQVSCWTNLLDNVSYLRFVIKLCMTYLNFFNYLCHLTKIINNLSNNNLLFLKFRL
jgi:hypothetical protein